MIAGIAAAARSIRPECRVFATEPTGKRLQESIAMGQRVAFPDIADVRHYPTGIGLNRGLYRGLRDVQYDGALDGAYAFGTLLLLALSV